MNLTEEKELSALYILNIVQLGANKAAQLRVPCTLPPSQRRSVVRTFNFNFLPPYGLCSGVE